MLIVLPDVVDGLLVNAAWAVAGMVAKTRYSRRTSAALDLAGWADTEALIRTGLPGVRLELPELSESQTAQLAAALERHEVQGALQALLAARLTDAPETDVARARDAVRLALTSAAPGGTTFSHPLEGQWEDYEGDLDSASARYAAQLTEYFDDKISALVAELEGRVGLEGLAQVRAEAYSGRIVALLGAIERQVAALSAPGRGGKDETEWLSRYRRQARAQHGYLYPPDFDRRRKVRAETIYVNTPVTDYSDAERGSAGQAMNDRRADEGAVDAPRPQTEKARTVMDLAARIGRTVLLGDPGGGKTTAANVLATFFAGDPARRVPFLVTLREYAAKMPPEWSVTEYIERTLRTLYQCDAPPGLVERLLLTGRAVVIFDGLDELIDTSRRRDVSERVEQFCAAFPLSPVLVTSRVVGYNQARLDDAQFSCYRLSGFGDAQVAEYAGKWFATQDGILRAEVKTKAAAFLQESSNATDLRSNPLLLSLMCILYRGAGSLPGDRAGIYARCAELMLRKWDEQRDLYRKLEADHLVEPALRHLAWWLFTRKDSQTAATERELITKTTEFLHGRGYETEEQAQAAAGEFVEFCRGRMWVFSDAGTTADGEELYGFTHRTFLEYFAAWHLAAASDTPEDLARAIAPHIPSEGWGVIGELAVKIKSDASDRAADRVYAALLTSPGSPGDRDRAPLLRFLIRCLDSVRPSPSTVRELARTAVDFVFDHSQTAAIPELTREIFAHDGRYRELIEDELSNYVTATATSRKTVRDGLLLLLEARWVTTEASFWWDWAQEQALYHQEIIHERAVRDLEFRKWALIVEIVPVAQALTMPDGLRALVEEGHYEFAGGKLTPCILWPEFQDLSTFTSIGQHLLTSNPTPPWVRSRSAAVSDYGVYLEGAPKKLDEVTMLGLAAMVCMTKEIAANSNEEYDPPMTARLPRPLQSYFDTRAAGTQKKLRDLPVPEQFRQVFQDWANGRVNFVDILESN